MFGASVAPTIEPVAKITAELAPVSACAAASRSTLPRARASLVTSTVAVVSSIGIPARQAPGREPHRFIARHYEDARGRDQPAQTGLRYAKGASTCRGTTLRRFATRSVLSRPLLARSLFGSYRTGLVDLRARIRNAGARETWAPVKRNRGGEAEEAGAAHAKLRGAL